MEVSVVLVDRKLWAGCGLVSGARVFREVISIDTRGVGDGLLRCTSFAKSLGLMDSLQSARSRCEISSSYR
jgi:hypothetical protein